LRCAILDLETVDQDQRRATDSLESQLAKEKRKNAGLERRLRAVDAQGVNALKDMLEAEEQRNATLEAKVAELERKQEQVQEFCKSMEKPSPEYQGWG
jgi:hypothetical protein